MLFSQKLSKCKIYHLFEWELLINLHIQLKITKLSNIWLSSAFIPVHLKQY